MVVGYWIVAGLLAAFYPYAGGKKVVQSRERLAPMMGGSTRSRCRWSGSSVSSRCEASVERQGSGVTKMAVAPRIWPRESSSTSHRRCLARGEAGHSRIRSATSSGRPGDGHDMAHPGHDVQDRTRNRGSQCLAVGERIDRILVAVHDRGRRDDRRQRGEQVGGVHPHGPVVVGRGRRVGCPRQCQLQHRAGGGLVERPNRPVEDPEQGHVGFHARRQPGSLMCEERRRRRRQIIRVGRFPGQRPCPRRTRIMAHRRAGHHRQRPDPFRRVHPQPLRDHAAQGSAGHMGGIQPVTVQHRQAVASHVRRSCTDGHRSRRHWTGRCLDDRTGSPEPRARRAEPPAHQGN